MFGSIRRFISECSGSLTLSSSKHGEKFDILSEDLKQKKARKTEIPKRNPDGNSYLYYNKVTMKGNCCWKVWNRYITGLSRKMETEGVHQPGWKIKIVQLIKKCSTT